MVDVTEGIEDGRVPRECGMNRGRLTISSYGLCVPRECGDEPGMEAVGEKRRRCSPRVRGGNHRWIVRIEVATGPIGDFDGRIALKGRLTRSLYDRRQFDPKDRADVPQYQHAETTGSWVRKAASKTRYTCPTCNVNAWAKPDVRLVCDDCKEVMKADEGEENGEG